jgi:cold shock protein
MVGGKVRFYESDRRSGSIAPHDGSEDVFVHAMALERAGVFDLTEGQEVSYEARRDALTGRLAVGVLQIPPPCRGEAAQHSTPEKSSADRHVAPQQATCEKLSATEPEYQAAKNPRFHRPEM